MRSRRRSGAARPTGSRAPSPASWRPELITTRQLSEIPSGPAVYGLWAGSGRHAYCAYVGITDTLRRRIIQHLVTRDSSIVTGAAAASLRPELVTEVRWWEHRQFRDDTWRAAAEIIADGVLFPTLRTRGRPAREAQDLAGDPEFARETTALFEGEPSGRFVVPSFAGMFERLVALEARVQALEQEAAGSPSRRRAPQHAGDE